MIVSTEYYCRLLELKPRRITQVNVKKARVRVFCEISYDLEIEFLRFVQTIPLFPKLINSCGQNKSRIPGFHAGLSRPGLPLAEADYVLPATGWKTPFTRVGRLSQVTAQTTSEETSKRLGFFSGDMAMVVVDYIHGLVVADA